MAVLTGRPGGAGGVLPAAAAAASGRAVVGWGVGLTDSVQGLQLAPVFYSGMVLGVKVKQVAGLTPADVNMLLPPSLLPQLHAK